MKKLILGSCLLLSFASTAQPSPYPLDPYWYPELEAIMNSVYGGGNPPRYGRPDYPYYNNQLAALGDSLRSGSGTTDTSAWKKTGNNVTGGKLGTTNNASWTLIANNLTVATIVNTTGNLVASNSLVTRGATMIDRGTQNVATNLRFGGTNTLGAELGTNSIGIGNNVLRNISSLGFNIGIGNNAAQSVTRVKAPFGSSTAGIFIGYDAAARQDTVNDLIAIGFQSFDGELAPIGNVAYDIGIGTQTGYSTDTGDRNIYIGYRSGFYGDVSNSIIIGHFDTNDTTNLNADSDNRFIVSNRFLTHGADYLYGDMSTGQLKLNGSFATGGTLNFGAGGKYWKLGDAVTAAVTLNATKYIEIEINGTTYKLLIAN